MRTLWVDNHEDSPVLIGLLGGLVIAGLVLMGVLFA